MIFLIPIFIIVGVLFGIDYVYFDRVEVSKIEKNVKEISKKDVNDYINKITK